jgi:hypothetical protein
MNQQNTTALILIENQSIWQLLVASNIAVRIYYLVIIKVIIMDADTGIDDAIAIMMMALQSPEIEIVGITTVSSKMFRQESQL